MFETLRAYGGRLFRAAEHLERLDESCRGLGRRLPEPPAQLRAWMSRSLGESGFSDALLRISVHWPETGEGRVALIVREFHYHPRNLYQNGVALTTAVQRRWTLKAQDPQIKASQFMSGVMARLDEIENPAHERLFLNQDGYVAEGTTSNIFIAQSKRLLTPSVGSGILRGVTRGIVIDLARRLKITVLERPMTRHEIYSADECFITNTSSEVLPVTSLDRRMISDGAPGPITQSLIKEFRRLRRSNAH